MTMPSDVEKHLTRLIFRDRVINSYCRQPVLTLHSKFLFQNCGNTQGDGVRSLPFVSMRTNIEVKLTRNIAWRVNRVLICSFTPDMYDLRNRKHVPCFYPVIEILAKAWENSKKLWKHSPAARVPTAFLVLPNFHSCFYNWIETRYMFSIS